MKLKNNKIIFFFLGGFFILFFLFLPKESLAASLNFSPSAGTFTVGKNFTVTLYVTSTDQAMNGAEGNVTFSSDKLRVVSISQAGTIINYWVERPSFDNNSATVFFSGIDLNPGYQGGFGRIITITFRALTTGIANVNFRAGTVLANDGVGTNITSGLGGARFTLVEGVVTKLPAAPNVTSSTHPDQNSWYSNNSPLLQWELNEDTTAISYALDKNANSDPEFITEELISEIKYEDLEEGEWYFHINAKNKFGWGKISHRKILVDTKPPEEFDILVNYSGHIHIDNVEFSMNNLEHKGKHKDPKPVLFFETQDKLSGINYYEIKIGDGDIFIISLYDGGDYFYTMPLQAPGVHSVTIWAVDNAGNRQVSHTEILIEPWFDEMPLIPILILNIIILVIVILWLLYKQPKLKEKLRGYAEDNLSMKTKKK